MAGEIPFEGSEYAEALDTLRTILREQRYEDFYYGIQVYLQGRDAGQPDKRKYVLDHVILPFVQSYVIGRKLHSDKLIVSWQKYFQDKMSGVSWERNITDTLSKDAETFAKAVKAILKNIEEFGKSRQAEP